MKFGQIIEYNKINTFLQKTYRKWDRKTSSRPLSFFKKSLVWGKTKRCVAWFRQTSIARNLAYNKANCKKCYIIILEIWPVLIFRKRSRNSFSAIFCVWFFKKNVLMLYSINCQNSIVWLTLLIKILRNMCIAIVCFPGCDIINFETNLIFPIMPFCTWLKIQVKYSS